MCTYKIVTAKTVANTMISGLQWWCFILYLRPQYLHIAGSVETVSSWIYSTGWPKAPPPPSHTATCASTSITDTEFTKFSALLLCIP